MRYKIAVLVISVVVAFLVHFPELLSLVDISHGISPFGDIGVSEVVVEIAYLSVTLIFMFWLNTYIFKFNKANAKIGWAQLTASFLITLLLNSLLGQTFIWMHNFMNMPAIDANLHHYLHPLRDLIISFIITGGSYILYLISKQQNILVENQQLRTENIRNQYETLKNQLNPHMFFNSLNTLSSLIRESPQRAQTYTYELSRVLRYTMQTNDPKGITLAEELEFINGFIFLLKCRYEDNLEFEINIDEQLKSYLLPPMALQVLVENAVKHNEISGRRPLKVTISTQADRIVVSNPIQPKITPNRGSGIGLHNLSKRYQLLFHRDIEITNTNAIYSVSIPLISSNEKDSNN